MQEFQIELQNGITINSKLNESDIAGLPNINQRDMNNGYVWYALPPTEINGEAIVFNICFFKTKIKSISVSISNPEKYGSGWNDFSEAKEKLRAKDTEAWLNRLGHYTGNYPWGQIWAGYDSKGGNGHGVIRYAL